MTRGWIYFLFGSIVCGLILVNILPEVLNNYDKILTTLS